MSSSTTTATTTNAKKSKLRSNTTTTTATTASSNRNSNSSSNCNNSNDHTTNVTCGSIQIQMGDQMTYTTPIMTPFEIANYIRHLTATFAVVLDTANSNNNTNNNSSRDMKSNDKAAAATAAALLSTSFVTTRITPDGDLQMKFDFNGINSNNTSDTHYNNSTSSAGPATTATAGTASSTAAGATSTATTTTIVTIPNHICDAVTNAMMLMEKTVTGLVSSNSSSSASNTVNISRTMNRSGNNTGKNSSDNKTQHLSSSSSKSYNNITQQQQKSMLNDASLLPSSISSLLPFPPFVPTTATTTTNMTLTAEQKQILLSNMLLSSSPSSQEQSSGLIPSWQQQQQQEQEPLSTTSLTATQELPLHLNNGISNNCSEMEMKKLITMFVEIMNLQMNTDRLNELQAKNSSIKNDISRQRNTTTTGPATTTSSRTAEKKKQPNTTTKSSSSLFSFPSNVPPPPKGWPESLTWPPMNNNNNSGIPLRIDGKSDKNHDSDSDSDSIPELESIPIEDRPKMIQYAMQSCQQSKKLIGNNTNVVTASTSRGGGIPYIPIPPVPGSNAPILNMVGPVTGSTGIAPIKWNIIERMVIEDALEHEELLSLRLRKGGNGRNTNLNFNYMDNNNNNSNKKNNGGKKKKYNSSNNVFAPPKLPPELASRTAASITSQEAKLALQKVEEANRKLGKAVTMWRTRVATAVMQNEISKLEVLLHESPLRTVTHMQQQAASVLSFHNNMDHGNDNGNTTNTSQFMNGVETVDDHLRYLVPLTLPKNFASMKGNNSVTRILLAQYVINEFSPNHFVIPGQNGRSMLHMACMLADLPILKLILDHAKQTLHPTIVCDVLMKRCHDSGWNAFHYAISSGSLRVVEAMLQSLSGENELIQKIIASLTNDTLTWKRGETIGVSSQFLASALISYHPETRIETHGMALQEIVNHRIRNKTVGAVNTIDPSWYVAFLTQIAICLTLVQANGHVPLEEEDIVRIERDTIKQLEESQLEKNNVHFSLDSDGRERMEDDRWMDDSDDETSPTTTNVEQQKKKSKKKKKKNKQQQNMVGSAAPPSVSSKGTDRSNTNTDNTKISPDIEPSERDMASVDESDVSKPSVATTSASAAVDPLVTALLGMGFEQAAITNGINACGGLLRATADDVVAWIVGGGSETKPTTNLTENETKPKPSEKQKVQSKASKIADSSIEKEKRASMLRREEEEQRTAEKLAAKREEQRRRNREWNNRAQARQLQETQEKIVKAATVATAATISAPKQSISIGGATMRTSSFITPTGILQHSTTGSRGHVPSSSVSNGFDPSSATPSRMAVSASNRTTGRLNLGPSAAETPFDNGYGNDGSTIASSVDHGIIDIGANDDATVSTIGSFPAVYPPQPVSHAPPGFASGPILPSMDGNHLPHRGITQAQWEAHRALSMNDAYPHSEGVYLNSLGAGALGITSIIPEASPLPSHQHQHGLHYEDIPTSSNIPSQPSVFPPTSFGSYGASPPFEQRNSSLFGTSGLMDIDGGGGIGRTTAFGIDKTSDFNSLLQPTSGLPLSSFSNHYNSNLEQPLPTTGAHSSTRTASSLFLNNTSQPATGISGLFGFGSTSEVNQKAIDASIIDSISTSNAGMGGLWGSPPRQNNGIEDGVDGIGPSSTLLGSLLFGGNSSGGQNNIVNNDMNQQQSIESQFPETSFLSKDAVSWEQRPIRPTPQQQDGMGGSTHHSTSIW